MSPAKRRRVLVLGGGYVGLYVAKSLARYSESPIDVTVVEPRAAMTYQPLLPEVAGGHVIGRDVTVELQQALPHTEVVRGSVEELRTGTKVAVVRTATGETQDLSYDHAVIALGAVTRTFPTPGLAEFGVGFKTVEEAEYVRNRLLVNVGRAAATDDAAERERLLTTVFVGGGYTGVEALGELLNLSLAAIAAQPRLRGERPRWVLVEALNRVAPEVGPELSAWTLDQLRERGVDVRLETQMKSCEDGVVELSTGERIPSSLLVWTAGVKPNPVLDAMDVPRGPKGHVAASATLQVVREDGSWVEGVWAAGDVAQVPDLTAAHQPAFYPPNAQNAVRQAPVLAENIVRHVHGQPPKEYRHRSLGTIAAYGVGRGAANVLGHSLRNWGAWLAHRGYHLYAMPTMDRRVRILAGWIADAVAKPDLTPTDDAEDPRKDFVRAAHDDDERPTGWRTAMSTASDRRRSRRGNTGCLESCAPRACNGDLRPTAEKREPPRGPDRRPVDRRAPRRAAPPAQEERTMAITVPTVDIGAYVRGGTPEEKAAVAAAIDRACREVGFIQIVGHDVPEECTDGLADAIVEFFALPLETKRQYRTPPGVNRGYAPPKTESLSLSLGVESASRMNDFFEAFNVGDAASDFPELDLPERIYNENVWPDAAPGFEPRVMAYYREASRVARTMVRIFADALDLPEGFFDAYTRHSLDVLRMNNYALPEGTDVTLDGDLTGMGEHTDYGIVTILWADQVRGLQVLGTDGSWNDVSPADGALLINLGDITARWTNERWMSTLHRVKPPVIDGTIQRRRSAAFFHDGDFDAVIRTLPGTVNAEHPDLYPEPVTVEEHISRKLAGSRAGTANTAATREAARVLAAQ